jgi:hypothetical protein
MRIYKMYSCRCGHVSNFYASTGHLDQKMKSSNLDNKRH